MTATVHQFPAPSPRLRLVSSETVKTRQVDIAQAAKYVYAASINLEIAAACGNPKALEQALHDLEGAAFHLSTQLGCREADRSFRDMLSARLAKRDRAVKPQGDA